MDARLVVVCVALSLCGALAYPRAAEPDTEDVPQTIVAAKEPQPLDDAIDVSKLPEKRDSEIPIEDEAGKKVDVNFPQDGEKMTADDDVTRSKKDTRDTRYRPPHTTTVCIHVKSHDLPSSVICGDPIGQQKEVKPQVTHARYAEPDPYTGEYYYRPGIGRAQEVPVSPYPGGADQQMPTKGQLNPGSSPNKPAAGHGSPKKFRTSEPEPEKSVPAAGSGNQAPLQVVPGGTPPGPVVVHRQYYQGYPPFQPNMVAPYPSPLRLNCAFHPESGPLPFMRSAGTEGYPLEVAFKDGPLPRMAEGPAFIDQQYYGQQGFDDQQIVGSPYSPEYGYEDGYQQYLGAEEEAQGRAADDDQDRYLEEMEGRASAQKAQLQQKDRELQDAKDRLTKMEREMAEMRELKEMMKKKQTEMEKEKTHGPDEKKDSVATPQDSAPAPAAPGVPPAAPEGNKPAKRHTYKYQL